MILTKDYLKTEYPNFKIEEINLPFSNITEIEKDAFSYYKNLKYLYLHNNQITKIEGLENLINLEKLRLDNNKITKIEGLENLIKLKNLWLDNNKLNKNSYFLIKKLETFIYFSYNEKNKNKLIYLKYNKII